MLHSTLPSTEGTDAMSNSLLNKAVVTGYTQTTPTVVLGGISSLVAAYECISSIVAGYDVDFRRGNSPTRGRPAIYWLILVPATLTTSIQAIRLVDRVGNRSTDEEVRNARQEISSGDLLGTILKESLGLYSKLRILKSGYSGGKQKFPLSKLGYASTAFAVVTKAYGLYEAGRELLSREETQAILAEVGIIASTVRGRVRARFRKMRPLADVMQELVAELRSDLTPEQRRLLVEGMTGKDGDGLSPLSDVIGSLVDDIYPDLTPEQKQMLIESMQDGQNGQ